MSSQQTNQVKPLSLLSRQRGVWEPVNIQVLTLGDRIFPAYQLPGIFDTLVGL